MDRRRSDINDQHGRETRKLFSKTNNLCIQCKYALVRKEFQRKQSSQMPMPIIKTDKSRTMPHCNKCGKLPPLGIKRFFQAFARAIQKMILKISNTLRLKSKKLDRTTY